MLQVEKRLQHLTIALPSSFTQDVPHLREKTGRVGMLARALAIFRADEVTIYNDTPGKDAEREGKLLEMLLAYLETPPYLRRALFRRHPDLQFAGTLPPLRTPNHPDPLPPEVGQLREGVVAESGEISKVNAGLRGLVDIPRRLKVSERVSLRLSRVSPYLEGELVDPSKSAIYWGFKVTRGNSKLSDLVRSGKQDLTISTSRRGRNIREAMTDLALRWKSSLRPLVLFGSRDEGVPEILSREGTDVAKLADLNLNVMPYQGVETVRTEEAVLATLAVLNLLRET